MSNRQLKRLEHQNDLKGIAAPPADEDLSNEDDFSVKPQKKSIFQLLADASNGEDDEEIVDVTSSPVPAATSNDVDDAGGGGGHRRKPDRAQSDAKMATAAAGAATSSNNSKGKNRKKHKNKHKSKGGDTAAVRADIDDELEKELKYIEDESQPAKSVTTAKVDHALKSTLAFNAGYLNPEKELRQKFGAAVVREERHQQQPQLPRGAVKRFAAGAVRSLLIPDAAHHFLGMQGRKIGGITMEPIPYRVGYFEYKFSPDYWRTQAEFMLVVNSFNQDDILGMLQRIGDHVDTLLQAATICRINEEKSRASEFIEQAIFVMERAFHSSFDLQSGNCRLDYRAKPNRSLFIALFQHAYYLSERGCPRTALEVCKVLLSLDPEFDPLAVLLIIDHYALRAEEDEWLLQFYDAFQKAGRNLDRLVNFAFSVALSHFRLKRYDEADQLLIKALTNFPHALHAITVKNSIMMDKKTAEVFDKHFPYHITAHLYAERCAWMYRSPDVMKWMERVTAKMVDSGIRPITVTEQTTPPRNLLRHITQSHINSVNILGRYLPRDQTMMYDFDPFPPEGSYGDLSPKLLPITPDDMLSESTLANFLNSFNPAWDENGDNNGSNNVLEGVSNLIDAVLNLMSNITGANGEQQDNNDNNAGRVAEPEPQRDGAGGRGGAPAAAAPAAAAATAPLPDEGSDLDSAGDGARDPESQQQPRSDDPPQR